MKKLPALTSTLAMAFFAWRLIGISDCSAAATAVDHSIYGELLGKYVKAGIVDYAGLKKEEHQLDAYLSLLAETDADSLIPAEQFAFYINTYNASTLKLVLSGYPGIASIWDLGGRIFDKPFARNFIRLKGETVSLDHIENDILRPRFKDPRVHFAINCAARSCPPLRSEPYRGDMLDRQLDEMTTSFINNPKAYRIEGDTIHISKIFKWFSIDFKDDPLEFIMRHSTGELRSKLAERKGKYRVRYLDYDWSLNGN